MQMDAADAASRAHGGRAIDRDQDGRTVELAGDARGGDADHAAVPALAPLDHDGRKCRALEHAASRLLHHVELFGLPLAIAFVELGGELRSAVRITREEELERLV